MQKKLLKNGFPLLLLALMLLLSNHQVWAQCTNASQFGTINAPTNNTTTTITTCAFGGEYSTINNCTAGSTYNFNATGGTGNYITIRQGTPGGTVLGFGFAPVSVICTASGPLYLHYNTNAACGTDGSCHTGTVQCISCAGAPDPCTSITTLSCGTAVSATLSGSGLWSPGSCGFSTPGTEKVYSFTPTTTGVYSLQVNSTNSGGFIDYFFKAASGGCSSTGWTCIDDIFSPVTATIGTLTAGTTYYILLDPETSASITHDFQIVCPVFDPCASIPSLTCATPVTASTSGAGVWSPGNCGFSTPGKEQVYSFTPTVTGTHTLVITATNSVFVDYFYKAASSGCSSTGWTCIGDASFPESNSFGPLTAGTTYYILYDPETTGTVTQTFRIDCPSAGSPPSCIAAPTSPANGANAGCPNSSQTLSWPSAATATGYDVYFGTSTTPPFVATTASTSYNTASLPAGTYYWQIRPLNGSGTASGCTVWSFTKSDVTAPSIICPANVTANNSPTTGCSAVVTHGSVAATDNCNAPTLLLQSGLVSGATYPVGVTTNVYRATDLSNNSSTCAFTITVRDVTLPNITCPANIVRNNDAGKCSAAVTYNTPTATDNCGISTVQLQSGLASGSAFPVGTTINIWRATDVNANASTCSFTVRVNDTEPPAINCPANVVKAADPGKCSANLGINIGTTTFQDNCGIFSITNNNLGNFQVGTSTVVWVATDYNNNSVSCVQSITIEDQEFPTVKCPSNINVKTDINACSANLNYTATAIDNCSGVTLQYSIPAPATFEIGYTNVSVSATDASGNMSSCEFLVAVDPRAEICNGLDDDCDGVADEAEDWPTLAKRFAGDGVAGEEYGVAVDIDGDYAIVGSNQKTPSGQSIGSAYILFRDKSGTNKWGQITELSAPGLSPGDNFGASVAISGDFAAVGAPLDDEQLGNEGAVYIFQRNATNSAQWDFIKKALALDAKSADNFGASVALDGERLLVGSNLSDASGDNSGAAYMYYRNQGGADQWGQVAKLLATTGAADDFFGASVDLDGDFAIVGANGVNGLYQNIGAAYIFGRNQFGPDAWGQIEKIRGTPNGENDNFGAKVGISGPWAIVGADGNDLKGNNAGAAFIFYKNQNGLVNSWGQSQILFDVFGKPDDHFGSGVGIDAPYSVVASRGDSPFGQSSGGGFVYLLQGNSWVLVDQLADGSGQNGDALGTAAAISGQTVILGEPLDNNGQNTDQGAVVIYGGLCNDAFSPETESRDQLTNNIADASVNCFPVPFSNVLNIEVKGVQSADVRLTILNSIGQIVTDLYKGAVEGDVLLQWTPVESSTDGLYFLRLNYGNTVITKAIVRTK